MLDRQLWKDAIAAGKVDDRSGSWVLNKALKEYLGKGKKRQSPKKHIAPVENAVMFMPLNSGEHGVTNDDIQKWSQLYPAVNISNELRAMIGWLDANPSKRKTASGIERFINSWLKRAQDKGGVGYSSGSKTNATMNNIEDWLNG